MAGITTKEAAKRLGITPRRVQEFVKTGRLPASMFGGSYMIDEKHLKLVANRRPGRPPKKG